MPEPRGPEGAKCKCGHSMDQHTDSMAAAPCAFWGCRCDDFDQDPAPSPPRAGEPNVRPEDTTGRLGFDCFFPGLEGTCPQCGHEHVSLMRSPKHGWLCWPCAAAEQFALGVQDAEAPSPSPAGPGEAELNRLIAGCELAGRDERHSTGKLYLDAAASLRALLARLREAEETYTDEHGTVWSVPTAWAYMRACRALEEQHSATDTLRAEVARLSAELREAEEKSRRYQFAPMGDNHHNAALCPYCSPQSEVARLTAHLATARREEREAFTPKPTDQDKSGGWSISTAWIQSVQDGAKEDVSMEQVEAVLVSAAALRTREAAP